MFHRKGLLLLLETTAMSGGARALWVDSIKWLKPGLVRLLQGTGSELCERCILDVLVMS